MVQRLLTLLLLLNLIVFPVSAGTGIDYTDINCQGAWLMDFDENPIRDDSQNTNTGAWGNDPAFLTASPPKAYSTGYYDLDGDDYFRVSDHASLDFNTAISLMSWVNFDTLADGTTWFSKRIGLHAMYIVRMSFFGGSFINNTHILFGYDKRADSGEAANWESDDALLSTGTWIHLTVTFIYGTAASVILYKDGVVKTGSWKQGTGNQIPNTNSADVTIGQLKSGTPSDFVDGDMDEAAIFDDIVDSTEINDIMDNGLAPVVAAAAGQVIFMF